jgi:hypothetical protein
MNRFAFGSMRNMAIVSSACRRPVTAATVRATASPSLRAYSNGNTSSPKSAEGPSATSGGSRSKEAAETGSSPTAGVIPDPLAEGDARGRTGGGAPLESSQDAPAPPKVNNAAVRGQPPDLTPEQQAEVDKHNKEFEKKHGVSDSAEKDKVDKSFWSGKGSRQNND